MYMFPHENKLTNLIPGPRIREFGRTIKFETRSSPCEVREISTRDGNNM